MDAYRNVGTPEYPETWLHARAIALLYDQIDAGIRSGRPVQAYLEPGGQLSGDLCKNVDRVSIPNDLTGIGGTIPDLALHANNQPVRRFRLLLGYS